MSLLMKRNGRQYCPETRILKEYSYLRFAQPESIVDRHAQLGGQAGIMSLSSRGLMMQNGQVFDRAAVAIPETLGHSLHRHGCTKYAPSLTRTLARG